MTNSVSLRGGVQEETLGRNCLPVRALKGEIAIDSLLQVTKEIHEAFSKRNPPAAPSTFSSLSPPAADEKFILVRDSNPAKTHTSGVAAPSQRARRLADPVFRVATDLALQSASPLVKLRR